MEDRKLGQARHLPACVSCVSVPRQATHRRALRLGRCEGVGGGGEDARGRLRHAQSRWEPCVDGPMRQVSVTFEHAALRACQTGWRRNNDDDKNAGPPRYALHIILRMRPGSRDQPIALHLHPQHQPRRELPASAARLTHAARRQPVSHAACIPPTPGNNTRSLGVWVLVLVLQLEY